MSSFQDDYLAVIANSSSGGRTSEDAFPESQKKKVLPSLPNLWTQSNRTSRSSSDFEWKEPIRGEESNRKVDQSVKAMKAAHLEMEEFTYIGVPTPSLKLLVVKT